MCSSALSRALSGVIIAVIDDDESVREALISLLRSFGYATLSFASAEQFLSDARHEAIGLVITDVQMPGMGGLGLQDQMRTQGPNIPRLFMTAYPEKDIEARALAGGASCFLRKPFEAETLIACVEAALKG
ncbi:response regulator [Asticcacaulis sp. SL142]|uniref:response regulator transcription factor n=1 Tax=Asticcacaulis sp. SL142 TaxID=2995155 RepID=UPI00226CC6A3|nr:response regulator [Asticcacaulis sp. SL142]WAC46957.1 response regulator [Asticcacaulis sp. SL142]